MKQFHTLLNAKGATGIDKPKQCSDFNKFIFAILGNATAAATVKFQSSIQETMPDFAAAQSVTNQWDYIDVIDMEDGTPVDGDDGITIVNNDNRQFQANIDAATYICARITAYTAGEVTVKTVVFNHNYRT